MWPRALSSAVVLGVLLLTPGLALAQEQEKSDADAKRIRERERIHEEQERERRGPERDDPTARMIWQRLTYGIPTREFKEQLLRLRSERGARERAALQARQGQIPDLTPAGGPIWVPIGPTGADYEQNGFTFPERDSGRARTILPDPNDASTVYFLTSGGGLWVTHDFTAATTHWAPLTDTIATTGGGAVAFGRSTGAGNTTLYLGTGDPFDILNIGGQMFTSLDGGANWNPAVDLPGAFSVRDVKVDASQGTTQSSDIVLVATDVGLFRSINGGASFVPVPLNGVSGLAVWSIVQTSAGWLANAQPCGTLPAEACGTSSTIYISTDHGANWNPITNAGGVFAGGRTTLAVGTAGEAVVYALAENTASTAQQDVFRSSNGGQTWVANNVNSSRAPTNPNIDQPDLDIIGDQSWYNQMILVDPTVASRNTLYIGGNLSTAKSTDGGATWAVTTNWLGPDRASLPYAHADHHAAAFTNVGGTRQLIFGNDGGIFLSLDDGASWTSDKNNGLQTFLVYAVTSMPAIPGSVVIGLQDDGTRVRSGNTSVYNQTFGGDGFATGASQANSNFLAGTVEFSTIFHDLDNLSPDAQAVWEEVNPPLNNDSFFFVPIGVPSATADPTGLVFYSYSGTRVFKTADGGVTWSIIGQVGANGLPGGFSFRGKQRGIATGLDLNHIAVIGTSGTLAITTDGGTTWNTFSVNSSIPGGFVNLCSVIWADNSTIYLTSETPTTGVARVAKGTLLAGGWTFARADSGVPDVQANRIVVEPRDVTNQTLYLASALGVFRTIDGGASWATWGTGLPNVRVDDLYIPPDGSYLLAGTYGRGVWELPSLSFVSATLTDDVTSCNNNGSLDNGETGHLTITLRNDGSGTFSSVSATATSTNPSVSFPAGNAVNFPAAAAGATTTAQLQVSLNGASGVQQLDFTIAFTDTTLALPSPINARASFRGNAVEVAGTSATEDVEASTAATTWTVGGTPESLPLTFNWKRQTVSPLNHRWIAEDSDGVTDQTLTSPVLAVGPGAFSFTFSHRYSFEFFNGQFFDGGVIEISNDNGATWTDVNALVPGSVSPAYNGVIAPGGGNAIQGRPAFVGRSASYPATQTATVSLGTNAFFNNKNVRIRFRLATDVSGGAPGWVIDNIVFSGLTNTPFASVAPAACAAPVATSTGLAASANPVSLGTPVTFTATVTSTGGTPSGTVGFADGATSLGTGTLSGGKATLATSSLAAGPHSITATYGGTTNFVGSASTPLSFTVTDFTITPAAPTSQTINAGGSANYTVAIGQTAGFNVAVNFTCSFPAAATTCTVNPASQTPPGNVTVTAATTARTAAAPPGGDLQRLRLRLWPILLWLSALVVAAVLSRRPAGRRLRLVYALTLLAFFVILTETAGCGSSNGPPQQTGTPAGTYTITITGTGTGAASATTHSSTVTLTVN